MNEEKKPLVLVVDDVPENHQVLRDILNKDSYDLISANDGQEALVACRRVRPDLILLDIMMPEMDGYEVCEKLKKDSTTSEIPIIFLTAKADISSVVKGFKLGGVDYVTKPFNISELLARVRTHIKLQQQEKELRQMVAAKDRFISIIADDLRDPIKGLNGVLQMLEGESGAMDSDLIDEYIALSAQAAKSIENLANNLLYWSSLQQGQLPLHPKVSDIATLISEIVEEYLDWAEWKRLALKTEIEEGQFIFADEEMIRIVLRNLISNAIMFSNENCEIIISSSVGKDEVTVSVIDTGIGISAEEQDRLFQIDQKLRKKGTAGEMGSGMGLILCQNLLSQNDGSIQLESQPDQGTTVHVTLPRAPQD